MNHLVIGTAAKTAPLLRLAEPPFLLIDDGPVADEFEGHYRAAHFDIAKHSFNPLRGMDYTQARDFVTTLYSASPEGENTLTVRNGKRTLMRLFMQKPATLEDIQGDEEVAALLSDILLSPVLRHVLCTKPNFSFKGPKGTHHRSVIVKLNRAEIGDFDAFILASLLVAQHKGQIIFPDFGFYGRPFHIALVRQNRLVAGVDRLADLPKGFALNHFSERIPAKATWEDAEVLAQYAGKEPGTTGSTDFIDEATGGR